MKCSKEGCANTGTRQPILTVHALRLPTAPPAKMEVGLLVCADHAVTDPAEYVTPAGWQQIVAGFAAMGKATPDRNTLQVTYIERTYLPLRAKDS